MRASFSVEEGEALLLLLLPLELALVNPVRGVDGYWELPSEDDDEDDANEPEGDSGPIL